MAGRKIDNPVKVTGTVPVAHAAPDIKPAPAAAEPAQPVMLGKCTGCSYVGNALISGECPVCGNKVVF